MRSTRVFFSAFAGVCLLTTAVTAFDMPAADTSQTAGQFIAEAANRRDAAAPALQRHLLQPGGDATLTARALLAIGQIGDAEACRGLIPFLSSPHQPLRLASSRAAGMCASAALAAHLRYRLGQEKDTTARGELAYALGHMGLESDRSRLVTLVNNGGDSRTIEGLMQAIVYSQLTVKDLPGLDYDRLLKRIATEADMSLAGAYLIARVGGLSGVVSFEAFAHTFRGTSSEQARVLLLGTLKGYGEQALPLLAELAAGDSVALRIEAARALGSLASPKAVQLLGGLAADPQARVRFAAVTALGVAAKSHEGARNKIAVAVTDDPSVWVRVAALRALAGYDSAAATGIARRWLRLADLYSKAAAIRLLGSDGDSLAALQALAADKEQPYLQAAARVALSHKVDEGGERTRPGAHADDLLYYASRRLRLQTSRGDIIIQFLSHAPYAGTNFALLADYGYLDGMLWHRVIPNFVAQAGDRNDTIGANWGTIREEWVEQSVDNAISGHRIGTVGLATSGRDTGSRQFFINTRHNLHLNGRYTVFGEVISGMEVVYTLEEGDLIISAETMAVE